jgi:hypothetical protein
MKQRGRDIWDELGNVGIVLYFLAWLAAGCLFGYLTRPGRELGSILLKIGGYFG